MKFPRFASALVLVLIAVFAAHAPAAPKEGKPVAVRGLDMISKALEAVTDLSDEQKTETKAALADAEAQLVALRDEARSKDKDAAKEARKEHRQKAMEIINNARSQIETQLSDTQKKTFREALRSAREEAAAKRKSQTKDKGDGV